MEGEELDDIYGDDELEELEGEELKASLKLAMENQLKRVGQSNEPTPYETIMQGASTSEWKKAESKRGLGYSGPPATRTEREHRQNAREAEKINKGSEKDNELVMDTGEIWFEGSSAGQIEDWDNIGHMAGIA
ncbi:hypothetical protein PILCRDRAFT_2129 [Piloderma croceum F 1598]|uniref:Uncharacterized protein n=1 Tax=Piloderma croceum (strain F 1598) TaxID=765440 RepID=A0A0C3GGT8_PILCF|nr:hypothetical protein PILCRDRAFT_2129 [Piloderma croceum F 1598]